MAKPIVRKLTAPILLSINTNPLHKTQIKNRGKILCYILILYESPIATIFADGTSSLADILYSPVALS